MKGGGINHVTQHNNASADANENQTMAKQESGMNKRARKGAAKKRSQSCNTQIKSTKSNSQSHAKQQTSNINIIWKEILHIVHEETKEIMTNMNPEEPVYEEDAEV